MLKIAVIPGDGIGKEVAPVGCEVLDAAARKFGIEVDFTHLAWTCGDYYSKHGTMMPDSWKEELSAYDAIYFGAVGAPDIVPDHVAVWGSLMKWRRGFDQFVNLRPIKLLGGIKPRVQLRSGDGVDFYIVRENTEGEYGNIGGTIFEESDREIVLQESVFTRTGVDRIIRFGFELAKTKGRKKVTLATKSNGIAVSMPYWDRRFELIAQEYPGISSNKLHIDNMVAQFVIDPSQFDVIVASNLFGDILSDLGAACVGTLGVAASCNLNPSREFPSLFEPVHGSAPDIAGKNIANPIGMIWSGAMLLEFMGDGDPKFKDASRAIELAVEDALAAGDVLTPDMGGSAKTTDFGKAICKRITG